MRLELPGVSLFRAMVAGTRAENRRAAVVLVDVLATVLAIPAAVLLADSAAASWLPSWAIYSYWTFVVVVAWLMFQANRLYASLWRFASARDVVSIVFAVFGIVVISYVANIVASVLWKLPKIEERVFLSLALIEFAFVALPRLSYRYFMDGQRWRSFSRSDMPDRRESSLFVGSLEEAALVRRHLETFGSEIPPLAGLLTDGEDVQDVRVAGVPVLGQTYALDRVIDTFRDSAYPVSVVIFGKGSFASAQSRLELVRAVRAAGLEALQFGGIEGIRTGRPDRLITRVDFESLIKRVIVRSPENQLRDYLSGRRVMVTGGAGSIGSKLALRALEVDAAQVVVVDRSETGLFRWSKGVPEHHASRARAALGDVADADFMRTLMLQYRPEVVFHAAALKHVPIVERNWSSAIKTNVFGTKTAAEAALAAGARDFVFISTDKAVEPNSVLGLTKRTAEQICSAMNDATRTAADGSQSTQFTSVRFGNVFGSEGSVATIFEEQIERGGPVTITDPRMTRYFMTMDEAIELVILAAATARADEMRKHRLFMIDMGEPIAITELATTMINLAGLKPGDDIAIEYTGVRPGEKLDEKLIADDETKIDVDSDLIHAIKTSMPRMESVTAVLAKLETAIESNDAKLAARIMQDFWMVETGERTVIPYPARGA